MNFMRPKKQRLMSTFQKQLSHQTLLCKYMVYIIIFVKITLNGSQPVNILCKYYKKVFSVDKKTTWHI